MKRRTLVCAGIGVGTLIGARIAMRKRAPRTASQPVPTTHAAPHDRPTLRLLSALALFVWLHLGFRIPGPWDDIANAVTGVASAIKNWVVDLLTSIFDFLWDWAVGIYKLIIDSFKDIWDYSRSLSDWALRVTNNLINLIAQRLVDAQNFASWIVAELRNEMWSALSRAAGVVVDFASWGAHIVQDAYNLVAEKIYWPLWHMIQDVYTWVNNNVLQQVASMISSAVNAAVGGLMALPGIVNSIWQWIEHEAKDAIALVWKAKDFLLFVVTHPLTWWTHYLEQIVDAGPDIIMRGVANAAERNLGAVEDWAVKWIGA